MPPKSKSVDLDSMLPQIKTTPPANKSNKNLYTPHDIPLTEIQWYAESPVLSALALEAAKPLASQIGKLGAKALDKLGDAVGLGVDQAPKHRGKSKKK